MGLKGEFIGVSEAARRLGISAVTLRAQADKGLIECERGPFGYRLFKVSAIEAAKRRREAKARG